jgi:3-deoxy-7-phosphoheptulonate synthase
MASAVAGADGVIFEIHTKPQEAYSDGQQTLDFEESARLITKLNQIKEIF